MGQLIEEFAARFGTLGDSEHPEIVIGAAGAGHIDRRKILCERIVHGTGLYKGAGPLIDHKADGAAERRCGEEVGNGLIFGVNGGIEQENVHHQAPGVFKAIDHVEAIPRARFDGERLALGTGARRDENVAAQLGLPAQRFHYGSAAL